MCWDYNTTKTRISSLPPNINRQAIQDTFLPFQSVDWFDACFNAFRFDIFNDPNVLPYDSSYDAESWYTSQFLLILKANFRFRNNIIQNNRLKIINRSLKNGSTKTYPRSLKNFRDAYRKSLKEHDSVDLKMSRVGLKMRFLSTVEKILRKTYK